KDEHVQSGTSTLKKRKSNNSILSLDAYYNPKEAIDKAKEIRANKALIKWIVWSGILFSAFDCPYFEDYIKILNYGYNSPKQTSLALSILDIEAWCSPTKHSIYAFVIMTDNRKQYVYSLHNFSIYPHIANFNTKKILEILEKVGPEKFVAVVFVAESAMMAAKFPYILSIR
ncbi:12529_t:CDS:2, partial [Cetraspora pellucida]